MTNSIAIYDDRIEIANPGIFPPQITAESIKKPHESYPYNLKIAEALYKSMFLENWGSGAKRIMDACREQGVEEPIWSGNGAFVTVTFKRPRIVDVSVQQDNRSTTAQPQSEFASSSPQVRPKFTPSSPQVKKLVEHATNEYQSVRELTELCGFKDPKHFREDYIYPALAEGAIERLYPEQPNHPKQKYCLTEAALEWKRNL